MNQDRRVATHQSFVRRPDTAVAIGPPARGTPGHLALAASHWHDRRMSRYQAFDSIDPGDSMQGRPFVVFAAFLAACVGCSKTSPEPGCPGPWSSDPCVTGTVCEYSSPLTCEPGCSGGSYSRWECINGQWEDSMHRRAELLLSSNRCASRRFARCWGSRHTRSARGLLARRWVGSERSVALGLCSKGRTLFERRTSSASEGRSADTTDRHPVRGRSAKNIAVVESGNERRAGVPAVSRLPAWGDRESDRCHGVDR